MMKVWGSNIYHKMEVQADSKTDGECKQPVRHLLQSASSLEEEGMQQPNGIMSHSLLGLKRKKHLQKKEGSLNITCSGAATAQRGKHTPFASSKKVETLLKLLT